MKKSIKVRERKDTIKARKAAAAYIKSFIEKGNHKLTDYNDIENGVNYRYAQFNLPAKTTCPYATTDCKKFCYARRDERYTSVRENRVASLERSKTDSFAADMVYTIETAFKSKRYKDSTMILRIHESGDFYNARYLEKWIDVFNYFGFRSNKKIVFCFYTKCFEYLLNLDAGRRETFYELTRRGVISCSLSLDKSSTPEQVARAMKVKKLFPAVNIYFAIPENEIETIAHDDTCDCADCAKCGKCVHANGKTIACAIH